MIENEVLNALKERYGFAQVHYLSDVQLGFSGKNFLITDLEKNYFVKSYHAVLSAEEIREIHSVKFFYNEKGIPAIVPLRDSQGETFFEYEGRHYAVFPYVSGKSFTSIPSSKAVASMGEMLASQHLVSQENLSLLIKKKEFQGWNRDVFLKDEQQLLHRIESLSHLKRFDRSARSFIEYKSKLSQQHTTRYEELGLENTSIIHGDFHYHNVFFNDDDTVSHVFDFERVMRGPRVIDVIYSLFLICFDFNHASSPEYELEYDRAQAFLTSYHTQFPFSREELINGFNAYFLGELVHTHWIEFEYYFRGNQRVNKLLSERNKRVRYVAEKYTDIEKRFVQWLFP